MEFKLFPFEKGTGLTTTNSTIEERYVALKKLQYLGYAATSDDFNKHVLDDREVSNDTLFGQSNWGTTCHISLPNPITFHDLIQKLNWQERNRIRCFRLYKGEYSYIISASSPIYAINEFERVIQNYPDDLIEIPRMEWPVTMIHSTDDQTSGEYSESLLDIMENKLDMDESEIISETPNIFSKNYKR